MAAAGGELLGLRLHRLREPEGDPCDALVVAGVGAGVLAPRGRSRTSTTPVGRSALISAAAWASTSITVSRTAGSSASRMRSAGLSVRTGGFRGSTLTSERCGAAPRCVGRHPQGGRRSLTRGPSRTTIENMFESSGPRSAAVVPDDAVTCADALVASVASERRVVADRFVMVGAWADFHCPLGPGDDDGTAMRPQGARKPADDVMVVTAEGAPDVTRAGVVELGVLLGTSTGAAASLLRDVLELRHRLPCHWAAVDELRIDGWKARKLAQATRRLSAERAMAVDGQVLEAVAGLPWGRAQDVIEGKVIAADPAAHAARLAEEESRRFVSTRRRSNAVGLRTLIARGHAGDIARLEAMIAHLAGLLASAGDTGTADVRRAKALAMLANPALTCLFLAQPLPAQPDDAQPDDAQHTPPSSEPAAGDEEPVAEEPVPQEEVAEEQSGPSSAVELAVAFGRALQRLGAEALDRLRPSSVLYVHLSAEAVQGRPGCGVARVEDALAGGPVSIDQLRACLAHDRVVVKPVIDPTDCEPVDCYEIPLRLREAARLLNPYEIHPYGTVLSRQADLDHPIPYVSPARGGPPGQTGLHNLGPLGRRHHLAKTFDGFAVRQLATGLYLWRSPTGHWFQVDHRGTRHLGRREPDAVGTAARLSTSGTADTAGMSRTERRFRDVIVRHAAA